MLNLLLAEGGNHNTHHIECIRLLNLSVLFDLTMHIYKKKKKLTFQSKYGKILCKLLQKGCESTLGGYML